MGLPQQEDNQLRAFVYDKVKHGVDLSFNEWCSQTGGWIFHPIEMEGELVAVVVQIGNEIHMATEPDYKWKSLTRGTFNRIIVDLLDEYGEVITCVDEDNAASRRFVKRLGFEIDNNAVPEPGTALFRLKKENYKFYTPKPVVNDDLIEKLYTIEEGLKEFPQLDIPKTHYFSEGIYARELTLRKGWVLIGKLHKYSQINVISKGDVSVLTEKGWKRMKAPHTFESPAGTKRAVYVHEDTVWTTFIGTDETDVDKMDETLTIGSHKEYIEVKENLLLEEL
jgi:hypothetical protein